MINLQLSAELEHLRVVPNPPAARDAFLEEEEVVMSPTAVPRKAFSQETHMWPGNPGARRKEPKVG